MRFGRTFLVSFVMAALLYGSGIAIAQTVTAGAGGQYAALQEAVDAVAADPVTPDRIEVLGTGTLAADGSVNIPDSVPGITILALAGPKSVTLEGGGFVVFAPDATITGINISGGENGLDVVAPNVTFSDADISNFAVQGVLATNTGTSFTLNNVDISGCDNGVLMRSDVVGTLNNCRIAENNAQAFNLDENIVVNINDSTIEDGFGNGFFHIRGGTSNINRCIIRNNSGQQLIVEHAGKINITDSEIGPSNFNGLFTTFNIAEPGEYIVARNCKIHDNRERGAVTESGGMRLINCDVFNNGDGVQAFSHGIHAEYCRIYRNNALGFFTVSQREPKPAVSTIDHCDVFANGNNIYLGGNAVADVKITATNNIVSLATDRGINQDGNMDGLICELINSDNIVVEEGPLANANSFAGLAQPGEGTLFVDPQYVNVGADVANEDLDFRVKPGSPALLPGEFIGSIGTGETSVAGWSIY